MQSLTGIWLEEDVKLVLRCKLVVPGRSAGDTWLQALFSCGSGTNIQKTCPKTLFCVIGYPIFQLHKKKKLSSHHCTIIRMRFFKILFLKCMKKKVSLTSPMALERIWTIFSWGVATTLWLLISMMRWPTLTPPRSAIPPLIRLQIYKCAER